MTLDLKKLEAEADSFLENQTEQSLNHLFKITDTMKDQVIINGIEYVPKVIAPEPVKVGRWKPEEGEMYWHLTGIGVASGDTWQGFDGDELRYNFGNVYQTEALAILARDKQLLLVELQDFADKVNAEKGISLYYYLHYSAPFKKWQPTWSKDPVIGPIHFYDQSGIVAAIAHFGDRLNLLKV